MNIEQMTAAIKATDTQEQLDALMPQIRDNFVLLAIAEDHASLLLEDIFAPVKSATVATIDSKPAAAPAEEAEEEYKPSARKLAAVAAAVEEAAAPEAPAAPKAPADEDRVYGMSETVGIHKFPHLRTNDKGEIIGVKSTIENVQTLLKLYGATCRYNAMTKRIDIRVPGIDHKADNGSNSAIAEIKSLCRRVGLPVTELVEYLVAIADKCVYHPVRNWIDSAKWDGKSRLNDFYNTMTVAPGAEAYRDAMVRRWLISAVAAVYSEKDTDKFELVLVLAGPQGIGKTSLLKSLCPVENAVKDGLSLNPDEKDSVLQTIKHWLVELGELDGIFRKADIAKLKAFTSRTDDEVRLPYAHMDSRFKRRTVMFGSVNEENFLTDTTGNRRWLTLGVQAVNFKHTIDVHQLWAELLVLYRGGEQWHLTKDEDDMLSQVNKQHEALQPLEELLTEAFSLPMNLPGIDFQMEEKKGTTVRLNASMIVRGLGLPVDKKNVNEMASILRKRAGKSKKDGKLGNYWNLTPTRPTNWGLESN